MKNKFIGIIPARYASTRFPGKPLADLGGHPIIEHVYRRALDVLDQVIVATDDERIVDAVHNFDGNVVMTSPDHLSGTDRVCEAFELSDTDANVIINIQGDEPFIAKDHIRKLMAQFDDPSTDIATLARPIGPDENYEIIADPNLVKLVMANNGTVLYFSRSVIPFVRGVDCSLWPSSTPYYAHIGIYAYRANVLREITRISRTSLEKSESLEQLRWLQNGYTIRAAVVESPTIGIDTPHDLELARKFYLENNCK